MAETRFENNAEVSDGPGLTPAPSSLLRRSFAALSDVIMPPVCLACREPLAGHDTLCPSCWAGIDFIRPPLCDRLGMPMPFDAGGVMISAAAVAAPPPYGRARAVAAYSGQMRELVHGLKFHDRHDVRRLLGRWLVEAGRDLISEAEVVIPVPLSRWRLLQRRFNQAAILAAEVARLTDLRFEPLALRRTRATPSQVGLTRRQRQENVSGAFTVSQRDRTKIVGRNILIIDDVITTGATVGVCAEVLKRAGARNVDVLALALVTDTALVPL
jgi:ComF family protein